MLHTPGHSGQGCSFQLWGQGRPRPSPQPLFLCVPGHVDARQHKIAVIIEIAIAMSLNRHAGQLWHKMCNGGNLSALNPGRTGFSA